MNVASTKRRVQRLADFVNEFIRSNTSTPGSASSSVDQDIAMAKSIAVILQQCLLQLDSSGQLTWSAFATSTAYTVDQTVLASPDTGYRYAVTVAGTSGGSLPTFPTVVGDTVTSGGVTIQNIGKTPFGMWDELLALFEADMSQLEGFGAQPHAQLWYADTSYPIGTVTWDGTSGLHEALNSGITGASAPTWPTITGDTVTEGNTLSTAITWRRIADGYKEWAATTAYTAGQRVVGIIKPTNTEPEAGQPLAVMVCTTAGTSASALPAWPDAVGETVTDGTAVWTRVGGDSATGVRGPDTAFYDRYNAFAAAILAAAEITPDFLSASSPTGSASTTVGDGCWRDRESDFWWEAGEGRAPIFTNVYYHSASLASASDGTLLSNATREFAFGPRFGCDGLLAEGDQITVRITGVNGVQTYQQGDQIVAEITRAVPVEFGGGQTGDNTLTFSVVGSVDGRLLDYELDTTALAAYSDGGIGFAITPAGIDLALGDTWAFAIEGGRFEWRINGGSWSSPVDINAATPVALTAGLSATFTAGSAPSWVALDQWSFAAAAVNGPEQLRQPTPERFSWGASMNLVIAPLAADPIDGIFIAEHTIPSTAEITLQGSNDNFATTPLDELIPWQERNIWHALDVAYAKYRLLVNDAGSIMWLALERLLTAKLRSGAVELGVASRQVQMPGLGRRRAEGIVVQHEAVSDASIDEMLDAFAHACEYDEGRLGVLLHPAETASVVVLGADNLEVRERYGYMRADATQRWHSLSVPLLPAP